jgi:hypothetical protein
MPADPKLVISITSMGVPVGVAPVAPVEPAAPVLDVEAVVPEFPEALFELLLHAARVRAMATTTAP